MHLIEQGDEGVGDGDGPVIGIDAAYRALKENGPAGEIDLRRREIEGFREIAAGVMQQAAKRLCRVRRTGRSRNKGLALLLVEEQPPTLFVEQGRARFFVSVFVSTGETGNGKGPLVNLVKLKREKAPTGAFSVSRSGISLGCGCRDCSCCLARFHYKCHQRYRPQRHRENASGSRNAIVDFSVNPLGFVRRKSASRRQQHRGYYAEQDKDRHLRWQQQCPSVVQHSATAAGTDVNPAIDFRLG